MRTDIFQEVRTDLECEELIRRLMRGVSEETGIIRSVNELDTGSFSASVKGVVCEVPMSEVIQQRVAPLPSGMDFSPRAALIKALCEAYERYCTSVVRLPSAIVKSQSEMSRAGIHHLYIELEEYFTPEQIASKYFFTNKYNRDSAFQWEKGFDESNRKPALIPRHFCFFERDELRYVLSTNGVACGDSPAAAKFFGLLELIERDAFMLAWWAKRSSPRIEVPEELKAQFHKVLRGSGLNLDSFHFFYLETEHGLPVVGAQFRNQNGGFPATVLSASCSFTSESALIKAFKENLQVLTCMRTWPESFKAKALAAKNPDNDFRTFADHLAYHAMEINQVKSAFLVDDTKSVSLEEMNRRAPEFLSKLSSGNADAVFQSAVDFLGQFGIQCFSVDLTTVDVREMDLHVVRMISPQLVPVNSQHIFRHWASSRLRNLPQKLGWVDRELASKDLNTCPHPFP
jgi:ribosomal protein S12 methylthiotransferase accessory factor